ncbi:MAG: cysteine desulfurase [Clostridiales bacterium]|nr:cysteine desulfurase [Clostridiales bacterium]
MIYFDNAATTKMYPECVYEMQKWAEYDYFNPSALYKPSVEVKKAIDGARKTLLKYLKGSTSGRLIFTSSGTEADNLALFGSKKWNGAGIVVGDGEHDAVRAAALELKSKGYNVKFSPINRDGSVNMEKLEQLLDENVAFVSIMHVSNETGAVNDIASISKLVRKKSPRALFHSDGVQAFGKVSVNLAAWDVDLYSISAHKLHGPKGIGALYLKNGVNLKPLIFGGGQEDGLRSSTENTPAIMAFEIAADKYFENIEDNNNKKRVIFERLSNLILRYAPDTVIISPENGAPHILTVAFKDVRGETLLHALEEYQIYVGIGSACSSKRESRFKQLLGLDESHKEGIVRFSFSEFNEISDADTAEKIKECFEKLSKYKRR